MAKRKYAKEFSRWYAVVNKAYDTGVMLLVSGDYSIRLKREGLNMHGSFWIEAKELEYFIFSSTASLANFLSESYNLDAFKDETFLNLKK